MAEVCSSILPSPWGHPPAFRLEPQDAADLPGDWATMPADLLDRIKQILDASEGRAWQMTKHARLVNRHWCRWAEKAITSVEPTNVVSLDVVVDRIARTFTRVRCLKLRRAQGPGDGGLPALERIQATLRALDMSSCSQMTDAGLECVGRLAELTDLSVRLCKQKVTEEGLMHLGRLTNLASLVLCECVSVSDATLESWGGLQRLTRLSMARCERITDEGLRHLGKLASLTQVRAVLWL
ncbi:unnamed protein product [Ostreobium quekettii]|uniref:Uncharacterized protein n=1 Tax=Ostreobium quekettii TaxID=121088 RepID=A0A8S1IR06_9CHLO|nr:unnamed protein product [Ostreobium quekettii]